ncbi:hypothetical protein EDD27_9332 [Nonomuraea polychroma]|uniref:Uncharacterized protein n=1 Tax=Nonomuraea polychroma TaxID=46176 RepID=A0A438ML33_9ACTN|nr:hypothetical protein [Nonomuraea polychroma]RVX46447.1 hypothetical protein EDD27_9332 [Nonomuraea polychroma]
MAKSVYVAVARDGNGKPTKYNCDVPPGDPPRMVYAFGGTPNDPVGHLLYRSGVRKPIYGTSYATALVAAALARS